MADTKELGDYYPEDSKLGDDSEETFIQEGEEDIDPSSPTWKVKTKQLIERVVPSQGLQTLSSIFGELKERYDAAFWAAFVVTIIANVLCLIELGSAELYDPNSKASIACYCVVECVLTYIQLVVLAYL